MTQESIVAVDLFCGVGGLTKGLERSDIDVRAGFDVDEDCKFAYEKNNDSEFVCKDVRDIEPKDIEKFFDEGEKTLIAGCAPCQPFSNLNNNNGRDHEKWGLLEHFGRIVEQVKPDYVAMENVTALRSKDIFEEFKSTLKELGYDIDERSVRCQDYGVPQTRNRLILLASRTEDDISLIEPTHEEPPTVRDAISDMPELEAGERHEDDMLHWVAGLSSTNIERIKQSTPGGTWRDWDDDLILDCHKKESGRSFDDVYGRMEWDKPAPTITTQFYCYGSGRFGHPEQNRAISVREAALLQTFPTSYRFIESKDAQSKTTIGKWIGNAVPVKLAEAIGRSISCGN